jgi:hypothetical protein
MGAGCRIGRRARIDGQGCECGLAPSVLAALGQLDRQGVGGGDASCVERETAHHLNARFERIIIEVVFGLVQ